MVYAVDKKKYCGIQRDLRGPKRVSRYNFEPGCKMRIARLATLFTVWWSGQINIRNKSNRPNSRDEYLTVCLFICLLTLKGLLQRRASLFHVLH
jgi:hypothetical protein